jgi:regulator of RNase E activity RraB
MEDNWVGYAFESDEGPAMCLFNMGAAEIAPDAERSVCVMIRVPFKEPGENALGSEQEREAIEDFEVALEEVGEELGSIHFASVRGNGSVDVWFYATQEGAAALGNAAREICEGYDVQTGSGDDPEWQQYGLLFPSDEDVAKYADSNLIMQLEEAGDQIEKVRPVDHTLLVETKEIGDKLAAALVRKGFKVEPVVADEEYDEGETDLPFVVQATKMHAVTLEAVSQVRAELTEMAEDMGGAYDGWATPLMK